MRPPASLPPPPGAPNSSAVPLLPLATVFVTTAVATPPSKATPKKDQGFLGSWTTALLTPLAHLDS